LKTQGYSGNADYAEIAKVKQAVSIPVIANGDVSSLESYKKILEVTKADAVMIGRASVGNPHLFAEILQKEIPFDAFETLKEQFEIMLENFDEYYTITTMRKQILQYLKGMHISTQTKLELMKCEKVSDVLEMMKKIFDGKIS